MRRTNRNVAEGDIITNTPSRHDLDYYEISLVDSGLPPAVFDVMEKVRKFLYAQGNDYGAALIASGKDALRKFPKAERESEAAQAAAIEAILRNGERISKRVMRIVRGQLVIEKLG